MFRDDQNAAEEHVGKYAIGNEDGDVPKVI